jgi:hypothetical protein
VDGLNGGGNSLCAGDYVSADPPPMGRSMPSRVDLGYPAGKLTVCPEC